MPTYNRRRFITQVLRCFANRTYPNAELIVVDDSERSVRSLCERVEGVRYLRVRASTTGAKLNIGIQAARGDMLQKIDDDDYYGPRFLQSSVQHLLGKDPARTLVTRCCFLILVRSDGVLRHSVHGWAAGGGFCFFRELWRRVPFRDTKASEDSHFLRDLQPDIIRICDAEQYIVVRHGRNNWTKVRLKDAPKSMETDDYFRSLPAFEKTPGQLLDPDAQTFYRRVLQWRGGRAI